MEKNKKNFDKNLCFVTKGKIRLSARSVALTVALHQTTPLTHYYINGRIGP